jgi:hypothetical protein
MTAFATLELEYPTPTTVVCRIKAGEGDDPRAFEGSFSPPSTDLLDAVYALPSVLAGGSASLIRFADWRLRLQVRPRDADSVQLAVTDGTDPEVTVPVATEHLCEAFVTAGRTYSERIRDADTDAGCYRLALTVGLDDLERRLDYFGGADRMDDYEPTVDRTDVETFVFDCRTNDHLVAFVAGTDALDAFVADLRTRDDEYAADAYRQLLGYHDEIRGRALTVLRDEPGDERATLSLENVCWAATPDHSPVALDALAKTDRDTAIDVATTLVRNDETDVALAAADLLADIGAETVDGGLRSRIDRAFEEAIDESDDPTAAALSAAAERFRT